VKTSGRDGNSLCALAFVAIGGSKFKAVNSRDRNFTPGKIDGRQKQLEDSKEDLKKEPDGQRSLTNHSPIPTRARRTRKPRAPAAGAR